MVKITCMATFNSPLYSDKCRDLLGAFFIDGEWRTFVIMDGEHFWAGAANDDG